MKKMKMQNIGLIALLFIAVACVGFGFMKYGIGNATMAPEIEGGDLVVMNDSSETFSTAFIRNGKMMSQVVHPGEKATGGKGLLRIFVANKSGNYEIQYPYPRPDGKPAEIALTQVLKAAHNPELGKELYMEKGKIDDIRVDYEEVRDLEATY
jgi:hypothetical protein